MLEAVVAPGWVIAASRVSSTVSGIAVGCANPVVANMAPPSQPSNTTAVLPPFTHIAICTEYPFGGESLPTVIARDQDRCWNGQKSELAEEL